MNIVNLIDERTGKPVRMAEEAWKAIKNRPFGKLHYSLAKSAKTPPEIQHMQAAPEDTSSAQEATTDPEPSKSTTSTINSARSTKNKSNK